MKKITVFTTTYNRAYLLPILYESLLKQSNKNFIWLIIDDGSTDNTREIVKDWMTAGKIEIQYHYKENGGMHTGHNEAYRLINTEYNVCIDSDDFMPKNAIEIILNSVKNLEENFAGLVGLDAAKDGEIIGTRIPDKLHAVKLNELYSIHQVRGDKKLVYRTEIVRKYPEYPEYPNERFVPLDYLCLLIDQDYDLKPVNEVLCIVEYQDDGSTTNILKQYRRHPNGFAFSRISRIKHGKTFKEQFKNAVHLVSSAIFSKKVSWLFKSDKTLLVIAAIPFGCLLNVYVRLKTK
ncbi:glycosyltransferase family 2 protein [Mesoflavibacter zeaxanthinifaciens]|uniref:glycosyltransferase family 2 protein n=1 Tax=Mesoflavibacter zeaxanthinifaciens TaxID=393060 RepID=UPI003A9065D3